MTSSGSAAQGSATPGQRLDKWLWVARFLKTRTRAAELCDAGRIRLSGRIIEKAHATVRIGDVLTFPQGNAIRVVKVVALAERRGPPAMARTLYEDLFPPGQSSAAPVDWDDEEEEEA